MKVIQVYPYTLLGVSCFILAFCGLSVLLEVEASQLIAERAGEAWEEIVIIAALFAFAAGILLGILAFGIRSRFLCDPSAFTIEDRRFKRTTIVTQSLRDYAGLVYKDGVAELLLTNGERIAIPDALQEFAATIGECLEIARNAGMVRKDSACEFPVSPNWPDPLFGADRRVADPDSGDDVTINDAVGLCELIGKYRESVIFEEALPPAYKLARMFTTLRRSNGGLVLFGVRPDGSIVGLEEKDLALARRRLEHLAADLTKARVEIGRIELNGKVAAFAVFNLVPSNLRPIESIAEATSEVVVV